MRVVQIACCYPSGDWTQMSNGEDEILLWIARREVHVVEV